MSRELATGLILISGIGHLTLSAGSLMVPVALKWNVHLKNLQPLLRQMFWTYAAYILMINVFFGLICIIGTEELLNQTILAKSIHLLIAVYGLIRIGVQFFYFDRTNAPKGLLYSTGEIVLVFFFMMFTIIHVVVFFV